MLQDSQRKNMLSNTLRRGKADLMGMTLSNSSRNSRPDNPDPSSLVPTISASTCAENK